MKIHVTNAESESNILIFWAVVKNHFLFRMTPETSVRIETETSYQSEASCWKSAVGANRQRNDCSTIFIPTRMSSNRTLPPLAILLRRRDFSSVHKLFLNREKSFWTWKYKLLYREFGTIYQRECHSEKILCGRCIILVRLLLELHPWYNFSGRSDASSWWSKIAKKM